MQHYYFKTGAYSRWTVSSNNLVDGYRVYVSTSQRTAGAIDSLVWKNKEFINNFDHGRQLQVCENYLSAVMKLMVTNDLHYTTKFTDFLVTCHKNFCKLEPILYRVVIVMSVTSKTLHEY